MSSPPQSTDPSRAAVPFPSGTAASGHAAPPSPGLEALAPSPPGPEAPAPSSPDPEALAPSSPGLAPARGAPLPPGAAELARLRAELDRLDDALHDTLLARADVVARVGASAGKGAVKLRLGRQAAILRRLLARHRGPYPANAMLRLWLELLAGSTAMQGPFAVAVAQEGPPSGASAGGMTLGGGNRPGHHSVGGGERGEPPLLACAREQFGALTRMRLHRSPAQALGDVRSGAATVAVLPLPAEGEPAAAAWWTGLLAEGMRAGSPGRLHVVARLPLWAPRPEGAPAIGALVVAAVPPDPSGADRTLIGLELPVEASRARLGAALVQAGLPARSLLLRRDPDQPAARALAEVEGFVGDEDLRLRALNAAPGVAGGGAAGGPARAVVLGAYAVPLAETIVPGAAP